MGIALAPERSNLTGLNLRKYMNYLLLAGAIITISGVWLITELRTFGVIAGFIFIIIGISFFGAGSLKFYFNEVEEMNNNEVNEFYNKTYRR